MEFSAPAIDGPIKLRRSWGHDMGNPAAATARNDDAPLELPSRQVTSPQATKRMMQTPCCQRFRVAAMALLGLGIGHAFAESSYGHADLGTDRVSATARARLSVTVPPLMWLRIGAGKGISEADTAREMADVRSQLNPPVDRSSIPAAEANAVSSVADMATRPTGLYVAAWTNTGSGALSCSVNQGNMAAGDPTRTLVRVTSVGSLDHPGADLSSCAFKKFASNVLAKGLWFYSLGEAPTEGPAGISWPMVIYTISSV